MFTRSAVALGLLLAPTAALAEGCAAADSVLRQSGRVFGHFAYGDAAPGDLVAAPAGFAAGNRCMVRRDVLPDLERLLAAARGDPAVMGQLRGISCHRAIPYQIAVFCRGGGGSAEDRAISVAPPGHSEHATGYAIDFAVRPSPNCPDAEACMAATPAFRWLVAHAPRYGFEMSFPAGNAQRVKWEPWHWRWVGASEDAPGAGAARARFAAARRAFPANPGLPDTVTLHDVPPPPVAIAAPDYPVKRRRRR